MSIVKNVNQKQSLRLITLNLIAGAMLKWRRSNSKGFLNNNGRDFMNLKNFAIYARICSAVNNCVRKFSYNFASQFSLCDLDCALENSIQVRSTNAELRLNVAFISVTRVGNDSEISKNKVSPCSLGSAVT